MKGLQDSRSLRMGGCGCSYYSLYICSAAISWLLVLKATSLLRRCFGRCCCRLVVYTYLPSFRQRGQLLVASSSSGYLQFFGLLSCALLPTTYNLLRGLCLFFSTAASTVLGYGFGLCAVLFLPCPEHCEWCLGYKRLYGSLHRTWLHAMVCIFCKRPVVFAPGTRACGFGFC